MSKLFSSKKDKQNQFIPRTEEELIKQDDKIGAETGVKPDEAKENDAEAEIDDIDPAKANINRYNDPEGLTVKKMGIGLWLVENRQNMLMVLYIFLILIALLTWPRFLYTFGAYIFKGMNDDRNMIEFMSYDIIPGHDFALARAARPLEQQSVQVFESSEERFDFAVQIKNPNKEHWGEFTYEFIYNGEVVAAGDNFILPAETKHILALGIDSETFPRQVEFKIDFIDWQRTNNHVYPDWSRFRHDHLNILVEDVVFTPAGSSILTEKVSLNDLTFSIKNETAYNYWEVDFSILLYGPTGIIGVNRYRAEKLMSGDERLVSVTWPGRISRVRDIVISPEINITEDDIYIEFEGEGE